MTPPDYQKMTAVSVVLMVGMLLGFGFLGYRSTLAAPKVAATVEIQGKTNVNGYLEPTIPLASSLLAAKASPALGELIRSRELAAAEKVTREWISLQQVVTLERPRTTTVSRGGSVTRYTRDDVLWMEKIVMAEAEGESYEGMIAVANVVINRVRDTRFPNSVVGVIFEGGQFEPVMNGRIYEVVPTTEVEDAVREALAERRVVGADVLFFQNPDIAESSYITDNREFVVRIGNHSFYR